MDLKLEVNRKILTNSGKPSITLSCADCNHVFLSLEAYLYQANLSSNPRTHAKDACEEFITKLNTSDSSLFNKKTTLKKFKNSVCNCVKGVKNIEDQRSVNRAKQLANIGFRMHQDNSIMNLAHLLARKAESLRLHITLPELDWTFAADNAEDIVQAFAQLESNTSLFIRQFTNIESNEPFKSGEGFLPLKRFAAFILSVEGDTEIIPLSKIEFEECYYTDAETGVKLPKYQDLKFIDGDKMMKLISHPN